MKNKKLLAIYLILAINLLFGLSGSYAQTTRQFVSGGDSLVVYSDVPGHEITTVPTRIVSDKYTIRVRSVLTNNEWVDVFANYCYNRATELPPDGLNLGRINYHYQTFTDKWSHTFGNIEISKNTPIEVEIAYKPGFQIVGKPIFKAAAHPYQKVLKQPVVNDGKVYFTVNNPGQITIDINGQMDDYHASISPIAPAPSSVSSYPIHTVSLWVNPVMEKPALNDPNIQYVEPGTKPSPDFAKGTLYFKPGVHDIGRDFRVKSGKKYYIPGDAIVFGTMINETDAMLNTKIYGYGTLSGVRITHPNYDREYTGNDKSWKLIYIARCTNVKIEGLSLIDCPKHTMNLGGGGNEGRLETVCTWLKIVTWRSNGDGVGSTDVLNNCFLRTGDDASYMKGFQRIGNVFWRDVHAAGFHMANIYSTNAPMRIEDSDVIYNRSRAADGEGGGIFVQRGEGDPANQRTVNVVVKNFRNHDKLASMSVFYLRSIDGGSNGSSYKGLTFENIHIESTTRKQSIIGTATAPWYGGVTFDNVTFKGVLLTQENFSTYFESNAFVKDIIFKSTPLKVTVAANVVKGGTVQGGGLFSANKEITVSATEAAGYKFTGWKEGDKIISIDKDFKFKVTKPIDLIAVFSISSSIITQNEDKLSIYPNPVKDKLYISIGKQKINTIQLLDLSGKTLLSCNKVIDNVDISEISSGLYIVKIETDNNIYTEKITIK